MGAATLAGPRPAGVPKPQPRPAPAPPRAKPRPSRSRLYWILAFAVAGAVVVGIVAATQLGAAANNVTIEPKGTLWAIPPDHFEDVSFTLSKTASVQGALTATNGIQIYALTPSAFGAFQSTGDTSHATWISGPISSGSFGLSLGSGAWHLVFVCPSSGIGTSVLFTSDLSATSS